MIFDLALLASTIRLSTPLILTSLGGLFSERSGVVNIALEGIMLFGAFAGAVATLLTQDALGPVSPYIGVLAAAVLGGLVAALHAVVSVKYRADQIISGTAINLLAVGIPAVICRAYYGSPASTPLIRNKLPELSIPIIDRIPVLGELLSGYSLIVYLAMLAVPLTYYVVFRTPFGLRLRAVGEHPAAADSLGVNVFLMRYIGVTLSGVLGGMAGAFLSISQINQFIRNMSAGRGYIALAALIVGKWHPLGAAGAALLFGFAEAFQIRIGGLGLLPPQIPGMLPYLVTIVVVGGFVGRAIPPAAAGRPYDPGHD